MPHMVSPEEQEVQVVSYDARWPGDYARESPLVARSFRDLVAIEHIGSTAVPGLRAKPIVDILVGDHDESPPSTTVLAALEALGYEFHGEDRRRPGRWFWRKRGATSFNVSRVPFGSDLWNDNLVFRDYLSQPGHLTRALRPRTHAIWHPNPARAPDRPYRIVYRISGNTVVVLAVLDGRRDLQDVLLERLVRS
jgi:GrpB-like predicted nucleotidyltransferase (UPF0157 family)